MGAGRICNSAERNSKGAPWAKARQLLLGFLRYTSTLVLNFLFFWAEIFFKTEHK